MPYPEKRDQLTVADASVHLDELLRTDEVLSDAQLTDSGSRGDERLRVGVRFGRPLLYPVEEADLPPALRRRSAPAGARWLGALFAFDLDPAPDGYRYGGAGFTVDLGAAGATAVMVHASAEQLGVLADGIASPLGDRAARTAPASLLGRLRSRDDRPPAWTTGAQSPRFGWRYRDRRGTPLLPRTYGVHAVLEVPAGQRELTGAFEAALDLTGTVRRRVSTTERIPFSVPLPGADPARAAAVRLCMAADIVGYSSHSPAVAARLQHDLVRILAQGRSAAGVTAGQVAPQPQGDGQFTVLPVGLDEAEAVPRLVHGIAGALAARNAAADLRMRLRVALHRGLVREADNGWVGRAATAVHRLLDSEPLRDAVRLHPAADYVLGVPDVLYADVVSTIDDPPPAAFRPVTVDIPAKGFRERGWIYVPGAAA
ncbi:hypothetical protein Ade02nite_00140 [Paractinoplanes deccanensis]|uniref:Uncharacterized protein n=1 Tax=Paractinoplanes deccanensis TaxID=113561 RepID=A0ABQ3XUI3_9ACTN|nr:hypothetical protein [Actinoplanes deccanensis]GID71373.1 hypothetical protein Ade02nite_00140 [Actinoplanes deccanensis]